jgi:iron-sulfur cluster repair protein YtfE (RIC family)
MRGAGEAMDTMSRPENHFDSVTGCLSWEHARLDGLLKEAEASVAAARWPEAAHSHGLFEHGLLRHLRVEEDIVFPLFEARTGIVDGPTAVMRDEHRCIRRAVAMMRAGIEGEDAGAYADGLSFLNSVRLAHDAKEERILFPMTDRLLAPSDRARVAVRLRRE